LGRALGGLQLGEVTLRHRAHLREIVPARPLERVDLDLKPAHFRAGFIQHALAFGARLAQNQLRLAIGLFARLRAQLLRRDQRVVQRLVTLAECAQLLVESLGLRLEFLVHAAQPFEFVGDWIAELVHARLVVAAQRRPEVVAPRVHRCQMKGLVVHYALAPNRTVPNRTIVAPSSTAGR